MSESKITAPGPGWRPPGKIRSKNFRDATGALLNSMGEAVARANQMDFGREGIHTQNGFFATNPEQASSSSLKIVLLRDSLLPGTYDLPGVANGVLMEPSGNRLLPGSDVVSVVNYSTSIYGPIGGLVMAMEWNGLLVAVGSSG